MVGVRVEKRLGLGTLLSVVPLDVLTLTNSALVSAKTHLAELVHLLLGSTRLDHFKKTLFVGLKTDCLAHYFTNHGHTLAKSLQNNK
jgi:hypothetical protein